MNIITLINVIETNDKYIPYNIYIYIYLVSKKLNRKLSDRIKHKIHQQHIGQKINHIPNHT